MISDLRKIEAISIHVPREGHDPPIIGWVTDTTHFNPRAPRGARLTPFLQNVKEWEFQSTCPARGTTGVFYRYSFGVGYFNPRAPRGARLGVGEMFAPRSRISIHVPREGHDHLQRGSYLRKLSISIHVPREGHDDSARPSRSHRYAFQSTCPARGTTQKPRTQLPSQAEFQSTCPARGTTFAHDCTLVRGAISIHVPREGHDAGTDRVIPPVEKFQSTCPARGTTGL